MPDLPISGLPVVTALSSSYLIPAVSGSVTAQMTLAQVGAAISGSYVTVDGTQTIAGSKTFSANQLILAPASSGGVLNLKQDAYLGSTNGYTSLASDGTNIAIIAANGAITNKQAVLDLSSLTNNTLRTYTFPNKNGTVAMLSDITSSGTTFPYTGSAIISGSLGITGSINLSGSINDGLGVTRYSWDGYNNSFNGTLYVSGSITDPINPYAYSTFNEGLITDGIYVGTSWKGEDNTTVGAGAWAVAPRFSGGSGNTLMGYNVLNNSFSASFNVVMGAEAGRLLFWGNDNVALGYQSMVTASGVNSSNRTNSNVAIGTRTLQQAKYTSGSIAVGYEALSAISSSVLSQRNTAVGYRAGAAITSGSYNTLVGGWTGDTSISNTIALSDGQGTIGYKYSNSVAEITGSLKVSGSISSSFDANINSLTIGRGGGSDLSNTAIGSFALWVNTSGTQNTALGYNTLASNTTGYQNTALGYYALASHTTGNQNTAVGQNALRAIKTTTWNTAIGTGAGYQLVSGSENTFLGYGAGLDFLSGSQNIFIGSVTGWGFQSGSNNIVISTLKGGNIESIGIVSGSNNTIIGSHITGLDPTTSDTIILASGRGNISLRATGSLVTLTSILQLPTQHPLPAASSYPNSFAVSASSPTKPYYSDGTNWNALY